MEMRALGQSIQSESALLVQSCVRIPRTTMIELPIYGPLPRAVVVAPPSPDVYQRDGQLA